MKFLKFLLSIVFVLAVTNLVASESDERARAILHEAIPASGDEQVDLVNSLLETGSPVVAEVVEAWRRGEIFIYESSDGEIFPVILDKQLSDSADKEVPAIAILTGQPLLNSAGETILVMESELASNFPSRKTRRGFTRLLDLLALQSPDAEIRADAALGLGLKQNAEYLPVLIELSETEENPEVKAALRNAIAMTHFEYGNKQEMLDAVATLGDAKMIAALDSLKRLARDIEEGTARFEFSEEEAAQVDKAIASTESYISIIRFWTTSFQGLSMGAVLVVVALGLAITFGLMGVINMAHGEMIAIGAYAAFLTQTAFISVMASNDVAIEYYFILAIPASFLAAAFAGLLLERTVIRFLYKRPLESLLATWGVSLMMQQGFRLFFGAQNKQVNSPSWLLGNFEIFDISLGFNRVFVIGFAILIVLGSWLLMTRTPLGLCIRAVMQNPSMAASMGIRTDRVRMFTFAFGSGLAGLAGAFLSQIGSVGANLGQNYIVDSFMVVVAGGVGNIIGTVIAALGIGITDQALQPFFGPVMGRIYVLIAIILFLQWRPGGLFPARSRSLD